MRSRDPTVQKDVETMANECAELPKNKDLADKNYREKTIFKVGKPKTEPGNQQVLHIKTNLRAKSNLLRTKERILQDFKQKHVQISSKMVTT